MREAALPRALSARAPAGDSARRVHPALLQHRDDAPRRMGVLLQLLLLGASFKRVRAPHQLDDAERALDEPRTRASVVDLLAIRSPPEAQIAKLEHSAAPRPGLAGFARVLAEAVPTGPPRGARPRSREVV